MKYKVGKIKKQVKDIQGILDGRYRMSQKIVPRLGGSCGGAVVSIV